MPCFSVISSSGRAQAGSVYGRRLYEAMRHWDEDQPEWGAEEHDFAVSWRTQPK
jgi:hypothetical protein